MKRVHAFALVLAILAMAAYVTESHTAMLTAYSGVNTTAAKSVNAVKRYFPGRFRSRRHRTRETFSAGTIHESAGEEGKPNEYEDAIRSNWYERFLKDLSRGYNQ